jgi:hypothetical protein
VKGAHVVWVEIFGKGSMELCVIVNFGVKYKGNGGCTFYDLVEIEYEEYDEEDVLDVVSTREPVPDWGYESDYYSEVEFVPCACVW